MSSCALAPPTASNGWCKPTLPFSATARTPNEATVNCDVASLHRHKWHYAAQRKKRVDRRGQGGEMELLVRWWHTRWHTRWHTWWQLTEGCVCRKDPFLSPARAAAREIPTTFPNPTLFDNITKQHISPLEAGSALTLVSI